MDPTNCPQAPQVQLLRSQNALAWLVIAVVCSLAPIAPFLPAPLSRSSSLVEQRQSLSGHVALSHSGPHDRSMDPVLAAAPSASISEAAAMDISTLTTAPNNATASATTTAPSAMPATSSASTATAATMPSIPATLPRDCKDLIGLLHSMGLAYHPSVLPVLLDHYQQLAAAVLSHVHATQQHTRHAPADAADTAALLAAFAASAPSAPVQPPPIELMLPLAVQRNAVPLPLLRLRAQKGDVMLPPDRFLLTQAGWEAEVGGLGAGLGQGRRGRQVGREEGRDGGGVVRATANGNGSTVP